MLNLVILGIRGVPAAHGGFETFAEKFSLHLVKNGWNVVVYCQEYGQGPIYPSTWEGVKRIHIPVEKEGSLGSVIFDWQAAKHAAQNYKESVVLTLGYNTAIFNCWQLWVGQKNIINMDGIEWKREKWGPSAKAWFWLNERVACGVGDKLIADNPGILRHLKSADDRGKVVMIPYGGELLGEANEDLLCAYGIKSEKFSVIIARPEPENSFFEMISAYSRRARGHKLVVLGKLDPSENSYHRKVVEAASDEVIFIGAVYEKEKLAALRFFAQYYVHGHTVGGTNPSLVEALGAGCAVIAHDNIFNRWVAGAGAAYFKDVDSCAELFDTLIDNSETRAKMKHASKVRFVEEFQWGRVLSQYEALLRSYV